MKKIGEIKDVIPSSGLHEAASSTFLIKILCKEEDLPRTVEMKGPFNELFAKTKSYKGKTFQIELVGTQWRIYQFY